MRMDHDTFRKHQEKYGREQMKLEKSKKPSKHNNRIVYSGGNRFDSNREAVRFSELQLLEKAGKITELKSQVSFELIPSVVLDGRKKPPIRYKADSTYKENGVLIVEDAKSPHLRINPVYRLKKHLMMYIHNLEIREV